MWKTFVITHLNTVNTMICKMGKIVKNFYFAMWINGVQTVCNMDITAIFIRTIQGDKSIFLKDF